MFKYILLIILGALYCQCGLIKKSHSEKEIFHFFKDEKKVLVKHVGGLNIDSAVFNIYVYDAILGKPELVELTISNEQAKIVAVGITDTNGFFKKQLIKGFYYIVIEQSKRKYIDSIRLKGSSSTTLKIGLGGSVIY